MVTTLAVLSFILETNIHLTNYDIFPFQVYPSMHLAESRERPWKSHQCTTRRSHWCSLSLIWILGCWRRPMSREDHANKTQAHPINASLHRWLIVSPDADVSDTLMQVSPTSAPAGRRWASKSYPTDEDHEEKYQKSVWVLLHLHHHHHQCWWVSGVTSCCDLNNLSSAQRSSQQKQEAVTQRHFVDWINLWQQTVCVAAAGVRLEGCGVAGLLLWAGGSQD